jgi:GT2 family glycosyltransferase
VKTAAIIVNFRTPELAIECIRALGREREVVPELRVVLVDNHSQDDSSEFFRQVIFQEGWAPWVEFLELRQNGGFGWANNQAIMRLLQSEAPPDAVLLINPDARVERGAVAALVVALAQNANVGAVGSQLINTDGSLSGSAFRFPTIGREWARGLGKHGVAKALGIRSIVIDFGVIEPVDWVTGASVLLRTEALREVGLFDTGFFLYFEEVELMHRLLRAGWRITHAPTSRVVHIAGASTGVVDGASQVLQAPPDYILESRRRFFALRSGRIYACLAAGAWLLGDWLARVSRTLARKYPVDVNQKERAALLRLGIRPTKFDATAHVTSWSDALGADPAWKDLRA